MRDGGASRTADGDGRHFDLAVIGSGSGNSLIDEQFADQRVALLERGTFGGTCLNVGCIPTKMFVLPADHAASPAQAERLGVRLRYDGVDWPAVRDRIFGRIDPISAGGEQWRRENENVTLFRAEAKFVGERRIDTGTGEVITADKIVLAAGSRAVVPSWPGIDQVTVHTSDTVMRLDRLPESIMIIGGGFVAAEFAHVFGAFGTKVIMVNRSGALLRQEDAEISARFTAAMSEQVELHLDTTVTRVDPLAGDRVAVQLSNGDSHQVDVLLVATGRTPNSDTLDLARTGVEVDDAGLVRVDSRQQTTADGIWALGDICSPWQLKHVANHEARIVQHNLLHPDDAIEADHRFVPHAVFSDPQVAAVGLTEAEARSRGIDVAVAVQDYGTVAYGWAMEDTSHCCKLVADRATGQLVGAHLIGPQASTLVQPLIQAMSFGLGVADMARGQYWIHPALPEVIENALLALEL
ncbi:mycothione reductase [Propionibacteriaceae bacterium Y2011]